MEWYATCSTNEPLLLTRIQCSSLFISQPQNLNVTLTMLHGLQYLIFLHEVFSEPEHSECRILQCIYKKMATEAKLVEELPTQFMPPPQRSMEA